MKKILVDCAKMCGLAYMSQEDLTSRYESNRPYSKEDKCCVLYNCPGETPKLICSKTPEDINNEGENDCQVYTSKYINENKNTLLIAFRGTESGRDILTDLNIFTSDLELPTHSIYYYPLFHQKELRDGWNADIGVHCGFNNQFLAVKEELEEEVDKFMIQHFKENTIWGGDTDNTNAGNTNNAGNDKKCMDPYPAIIITGHSLGGALATISSLYFKYKYPEAEVCCITFGSPRAGSKKFVELFNDNIDESYRFVNDNDPVPCVPTAWRFKHVKGCQWLYQDKVMNEISVNRLWRFFKNTVLNFLGLGGYNAVGDHSCDGYIYDLRQLGYDKEN